ncbi:MAG: sulfatase [Cyclobacteriaceae bacterium]|nr:sulfatase [Cyclobacteriaceae bacterium]
MRPILLFVICVSIYACNSSGSKEDESKPNIILLLSDDHGAEDLAYAGNKDVATPFMDQLASEGIIFTHAFATASVCAPSRSSIYTGLYPHKNGCHQNHGEIYDHVKTLPHYLSELGYRVALAGKVHVGPENSFPFEYIERKDIPELLQSAGPQPLCLVVAYNQPHEPYFNKKNGVPYRSIQAKSWLPDTPETKGLTAAYYDNVENLDHEVGSTLYWLEKYGYTDNSIIIYTSDHGPGLPYGKWTLYEKALHVPLIIKWKGKIEAGRFIQAPVSLLDLLPSFMQWAGASELPELDGTSLLPLISGKENTQKPYLFAAYSNLGVQDANSYPIRSVTNHKYKLLVNFNHKEPFTIRMTERMDERSVICAWRVLESWKNAKNNPDFANERFRLFRFRPEIELYDLMQDPYELNNIAEDPEMQMMVKELRNELKKWMVEQGDLLSEQI